MWRNNLIKKSLAVGIIFLFIISSITPMAFGYNEESSCSSDEENKIYEKSTSLSGHMDSPWPMKCHDLHHTGRSTYSTADNPGIEKWRFKCGEITGWVEGGIVIGDDGILYFGDSSYYLYALNPDGTLKWKYRTGDVITSSPSIAEDGTIYVGSWDHYLYAVNSNNGTLKWKFLAGSVISSSPIISNDGTIYFGIMTPGYRIFTINPDGTEKWRYQTGGAIVSDPAIAEDGTIYIGSNDNYLYALYPNGTLRWRFKTGGEVKSPPSIEEDGTIYFGSFDDYLYALYPNGTLKWKVGTSWGTSANPSIADDGTIYVGTNKLRAFFPNGTLKWSFNLGSKRWIGSSSPAISADGTIYVGTHIGEGAGGDIIAVNPDGTERWRKKIAEFKVDSSPCIGEDGTVYIGSTYDQGRGYLHAFGSVYSNEPPETPTISGTPNGKVSEKYYYTLTSIDPDNNPVSYYVDWGDDTTTETMDFASGELGWASHIYNAKGEYTIKAKARDTLDEESDFATFDVNITGKGKSKPIIFNNPWFDWLLEQHPALEVSMPKNKLINPFERFLENHPYMFPILRKILAR